MGVLIDSSVLIGYERGRIDLNEGLAGLEEQDLFISVITVSELLHGVHRARDAKIRAFRSAFVEAIFESLPILQIDFSTARIHAQLWADLASSGQLIGPHDLWLAASAVAHGLTLVTANVREFQRVPGLPVKSWSR
ncbi:MAG: type II toxin-antitoxin system VapC family toxin [Thermoanaerobaculia bacterium]